MKTTSLSRRVLAVGASALLGVAGAVALASPASAHHTYVRGVAECPDPDTGEWTVTWTVESWDPRGPEPSQYQLTGMEITPAEVGLPELPLDELRPVGESFVAEQVLPGSVTSVSLSVSAQWNNQHTRTNESAPVEQPAPCEPEEPEEPEEVEIPVAVSLDCDTISVQVTNPLEEESIEATVGAGDASETLTVAPGESEEATFDAEEGTVATVTVGDVSEEFAWEQPEDCQEPPEGQGGEEEEEELPLTGSSTMLIAGGALALLAVGGGLFLLARRRRVTFTA